MQKFQDIDVRLWFYVINGDIALFCGTSKAERLTHPFVCPYIHPFLCLSCFAFVGSYIPVYSLNINLIGLVGTCSVFSKCFYNTRGKLGNI